MTEQTPFRLTIDDSDPTWSEWHAERLPDVHGTGAGHWWIDRNGRPVEGYEPGATCRCGWRPEAPDRLLDRR
jgi:hypothetical protein